MPTENTQVKILLIDDDRFLLDMYSIKFSKHGLKIDTASSSISALAKLRAGETYDIIVLDIIMPSMDGLELLEVIRKEKLVPTAVVIMLTNQADDLEKAKSLGIDGYIIKAMNIPSEVVRQVIQIYKTKTQS
ncbi:MAG: response regulator [Patescibacteria group bacterium]